MKKTGVCQNAKVRIFCLFQVVLDFMEQEIIFIWGGINVLLIQWIVMYAVIVDFQKNGLEWTIF